MRPVDPRLLRRSATARRYVAVTGGLAVATGGLVVAQAVLIAAVVAPVAVAGAGLVDVAPALAGLAVVLGARAGTAWAQERLASRATVAATAELRSAVVARALDAPLRADTPASRAAADPAAAATTTTLVTTGLAGLDGYLGKFLPNLMAAAVVTPGALAVVAGLDPLAAVTLTIVVPLIPLFMALVGWTTRSLAATRLRRMERLGSQVLDLVAGLPTLRAFGRARAQADLVRSLGASHRDATLRTLRVAFLSAFVLELLATIGVALVAVGVGFRLAYGRLDLATALAVLVLAPEVLAPLRRVGADFHASTDGLAALDRVMGLLDGDAPASRGGRQADLAVDTVVVRGVSVRGRGGGWGPPAAVDLAPGEVVALAGPSGAGKSTLLQALLGLVPLDGVAARGTVEVGGVPVADLDRDHLWSQVAWLPQRPTVQPGSLRENVALWAPGEVPTEAEIDRSAVASGLADVVSQLPDGWQTRVGTGGRGLSAGQRQRLALARVLLSPAQLVLLDEPTAHLDAATESLVADVVADLRASGRTVLVVSHRPAVHAMADRLTVLGGSAEDPREARALPAPDRELEPA